MPGDPRDSEFRRGVDETSSASTWKPAVQVSPSHYADTYDTWGRWNSYWTQIRSILDLGHQKVLEVGVGNRTTSERLEKIGVQIVTFDVDPRLRPEVQGSVTNLPFRTGAFGTVACFEVLEHLPYERFAGALGELRRVASDHVVLSLPDVRGSFRIAVSVPGRGLVRRLVSAPNLRQRPHAFDGEHYWEIGKAGYPLPRILGDLEAARLRVRRHWRVFEMPYHHFFVLSTPNVT